MASQSATLSQAGATGAETKTRVTVGVSDMKVSRDPGDMLITHSLGPCIGLVAYDPAVPAAGLLHYQLPRARGHEGRAQQNPHMFADTGIPALLEAMEGLGAQKARLRIGVFGGASMLQDDNLFKIGVQNSRAARKILWQLCLSVRHEDVGGKASRTVSIDVRTGETRMRCEGQVYSYQ